MFDGVNIYSETSDWGVFWGFKRFWSVIILIFIANIIIFFNFLYVYFFNPKYFKFNNLITWFLTLKLCFCKYNDTRTDILKNYHGFSPHLNAVERIISIQISHNCSLSSKYNNPRNFVIHRLCEWHEMHTVWFISLLLFSYVLSVS